MKVFAMARMGVRQDKTQCEDCLLFSRRLKHGAGGNLIWNGMFQTNTPEGASYLAAISDGVGGMPAGETASRFVLSRLSGAFYPNVPGGDWLEDEIRAINERLILFSQTRDEWRRMGATLSGVYADGDGAWLFHAGNSRIFVTNGDFLMQLTRDHTASQDKPWQQRDSKIFACMGCGDPALLKMLAVERAALPRNPGEGSILFTTDGIHDHMDNADLERLFFDRQDDQSFCMEAMKLALENGSNDDMSLMLLTL